MFIKAEQNTNINTNKMDFGIKKLDENLNDIYDKQSTFESSMKDVASLINNSWDKGYILILFNMHKISIERELKKLGYLIIPSSNSLHWIVWDMKTLKNEKLKFDIDKDIRYKKTYDEIKPFTNTFL